ncbi:hypothetical protein ABT072_30630 [Streptomyces sp. NPDC002589]|uniref:hypothetical protein n=1 Tax=Streptomyces sp. NPDC002589 TaxID=3154420 RepID=UPI00331B0A2C
MDGTIPRLTASGAYARYGPVGYPHARSTARLPQGPGDLESLPDTLTEVHARADDGFPLRGWLALPEGASAERPTPLIVVPHGAPADALERLDLVA